MNSDYEKYMRDRCRGAWIGLALTIAAFSATAAGIGLIVAGARSFLAQ